MADGFDPYHKWLGIPPEKQPPNHYQLLALEEFESDPDVIEAAADQRMAHLRTYQSGKHAKLSQQLLNELSSARLTLLNPEKKSAYDEQLRSESQPLASAEDPFDTGTNSLGAGTPPLGSAEIGGTDFRPPVAVGKKPSRRGKPAWLLPAAISIAALAVLAGVVIVLVLSKTGDQQERETARNTQPREQSKIPSTDEPRDEPPGDNNAPLTPDPKQTPADSNTSPDDVTETQDDETASDKESSSPFEEVEQSSPPGINVDSNKIDDNVTGTETDQTKPEQVTVTETPEKHAVPTDEQQQQYRKTLAETFNLSDEQPAEEPLKLADRLMQLSRETTKPVERFVILRAVMQLAGQGGDALLLMRALDEVDRTFEINRLELGQRALLGFAKSATGSEALGSLVEASSDLIDRLLEAGQFEPARETADAVYDATLRKSAPAQIRKRAYDQKNRIGELASRWEEIHAKLEQLKANPDDPELNLFAGKWYGFEQGDLQAGLPFFAKGSDKQLAHLATLELNSGWKIPKQRIELGDGWWEVAQETEDIEVRDKLQRRAAYWYLKARSEVSDSLTATKLDKRIEQVGDVESIRQEIRRDLPLPNGKRVLLVFKHSDEQKVAKQACERYFLEYDAVKSFDMNRADYSGYHTIIAGTNNMDYWQKPDARKPEAFQHLERFVNEGGHFIALGSFNARGTGHLRRFGINTSFYHSSTYARNGAATDLLFFGNEDIVSDGKMGSAGNFNVSVPHVVLLKRGPGSYEGKPALATLRHKQGRVTYTVCEPNWKGDMWLITVLLSWVSRGSPTPETVTTGAAQSE